ncbi:helix-turn-helix domain-containing protein [Knoellia sp. LjRoot47]|uniref:helix-turn-helix domain-containing protein n=1 Tax=Knoellia sp. LjRoot47 TaxID=3342330 RepID=UPI003F5063E7
MGTSGVRQTREQRDQLVGFVAEQYAAGRSLRELGELTGRTQTAIRRALDEAGVPRRGPGAQRVHERRQGRRD